MTTVECFHVLASSGGGLIPAVPVGPPAVVRLLSTLPLPDGGTARVFGHDVLREARAVRGLVNRVSVEAAGFHPRDQAGA